MGILSYIRKHSYLAYAMLLTAVAATLLVNISDPLYDWYWERGPVLHVGTIAGKKVTRECYDTYFTAAQQEERYHAYAHQEPMPQEEVGAHRKAWSWLVTDYSSLPARKALGLKVLPEELGSMLQGAHMSSEVRAYITDPKTGKINKQAQERYLQELKQGRDYHYLRVMVAKRAHNKLSTLMTSTVQPLPQAYTTKENPKGVRMAYVYLPYDAAMPAVERPTKEAKQAYLQAHAKDYQQEEVRGLHLRIFEVTPSRADEEELLQQLEQQSQAFARSKRPVAFAKRANEVEGEKISIRYAQGKAPPFLCPPTLRIGQVIGPLQQGSKYTLYRYLGTRQQGSALASKRTYHCYVKFTRQLRPSDRTHQATQRKALQFAKSIHSLEDWQATLQREELQGLAYKIPRSSLVDHIGKRSSPIYRFRRTLQWLYKEALLHQPSNPMLIEDEHADQGKSFYVVALFGSHHRAGTATLEQANPSISHALRRRDQSAKMLAVLQERLPLPKLRNVVAPYRAVAHKGTHKAMSLRDARLKHVSHHQDAMQIVGAAFGLQEGARTLVVGQEGIAVVVRLPHEKAKAAPAPTQGKKKKRRRKAKPKREAEQQVVQAHAHHKATTYAHTAARYYYTKLLEAEAEIEDMRWYFYL